MTKFCALIDFRSIRPKHESLQADTLKWIAAAHTQAEERKSRMPEDRREAFTQDFLNRVEKIGCKPDKIHKRGHELPDFLHQNWAEMEVFRLDQTDGGVGLKDKNVLHAKYTDAAFEAYYPEGEAPPRHLIHVSCTGYASPSSAQWIVAKRGWGAQTRITHAYHMGCYASVPAVRMGDAFVQAQGGRADIVHTELCTLHFNPSIHDADQLVLQSLFADGYIKYSLLQEHEAAERGVPFLRLLGTHEEIIPDSSDAMTWTLADWGFHGTLSKKIPVLIARYVKEFLGRFCRHLDIGMEEVLKNSIFAVHPGGPKILDYLEEILELTPHQLKKSREILKKYGNISSATIPHIWMDIANDHTIPHGTRVISLAFGPGLNIAGAALEKRSCSL